MRLKLALLLLVLSSLACMEQVSTVTPEVTLTVTPLSPTKTATVPTATARPVTTDQQTAAVVQAVVNVRSAPDGDVIGYLSAGDTVTVYECTELWCEVSTDVIHGWIWRGCLSDNPADLGCSAK